MWVRESHTVLLTLVLHAASVSVRVMISCSAGCCAEQVHTPQTLWPLPLHMPVWQMEESLVLPPPPQPLSSHRPTIITLSTALRGETKWNVPSLCWRCLLFSWFPAWPLPHSPVSAQNLATCMARVSLSTSLWRDSMAKPLGKKTRHQKDADSSPYLGFEAPFGIHKSFIQLFVLLLFITVNIYILAFILCFLFGTEALWTCEN